MKKNRSAIRIPMPLRYVINLILIVAVWFVLNSLIQSGVITNYWSGILITVGINIILATSLNVATGYLGQLPLGHAGFMAVGAYAGGIFMKAMPVQELLKAGNTGAAIPYILLALLISAIVAGIFGIIIGIPALRLRGDYLAIVTLAFGEIIRNVMNCLYFAVSDGKLIVNFNNPRIDGTLLYNGPAGAVRVGRIATFEAGFVLVLLTLYKLRDKPWLEFWATVAVCGVVEYFTAYYLETVYDRRWWDYAGYFLNLHGRICAEGLLVFGLGGMAVVYGVAPLFDNLLHKVRRSVLIGLCAALIALFCVDQAYSHFHPNEGEGITDEVVYKTDDARIRLDEEAFV